MSLARTMSTLSRSSSIRPAKHDSMMQSGSLYLLSQRRSFRAVSDNKQSSFRYARQDGVPRRNC